MTSTEINPQLIVLGITAGLILWVIIAIRLLAMRWALALMFLASSIGEISHKGGSVAGGWFQPVQSVRSEMFLGTGIVLTLGLLLRAGKISIRHTSVQLWWLLAIAIYQSLLRMHHDTPYSGLSTLGGTFVTVFPVLLLAPILFQDRTNWLPTIRAIGLAQLAWLGVSVIQIVLDPATLLMGWHDRFIGAAGNPQYAALVVSITSVIILWLAMNDTNRTLKLIWIGAVGLNLLFLLGTGSRMGLLMAMVGMIAILYRRLGRAIVVVPLVVLAVWIAMSFALQSNLEFGYERLTSMENTRTAAFLELYQEGLDNPVLGNGLHETERSENSYLLAFAAFGIGCVTLMIIFTVVSFFHCLKLWQISFRLRETRPYIDLILGFNAMYFVSAMLEGHILARAIPTLVGLLVFASMSAVILRQYRDGELVESAEEEEPQWDPDFPKEFPETAY